MNLNYPDLEPYYFILDKNKLISKLISIGKYSPQYNNFDQPSVIRLIEETERKMDQDIQKLKELSERT